MSNLIQKCSYLIAVAVLCFATSALAGTVTLTYVKGTFPGSSTGPYKVLVNGSLTTMICDDNETGINYKESWQASITNVASIAAGGPTPTTFVNLNPPGTNFQLDYEEVAWLALQMYNPANADLTDETNLQNAIWDIMSGSGTMSAAALTWQGAALSAVKAGGVDYSAVSIYTYVPGSPITKQYLNEPPQEFLSANVLEPPTSALFGTGLLGLVALIVVFRHGKSVGSAY